MEYLPLLVPLILLLMIPTSLILMYFKDEIRLSRIKLLAFFKPKSPLDREIAEEEKEIKFLTEQKAKIDRLSALKSEKDRLYQEVNMDVCRCKESGGTKVSGFHFYDRRLGQHIPVNHCSDCATPINEMERVR